MRRLGLSTRHGAGVALAALFATARPALAGCPAPASDAEARERLARVSSMLSAREVEMRIWYGGFAALHALMAGGGVGLAYAAPRPEGARAELLVGAVGSGLGLLTLVAAPPPLIGATDDLRSIPEHAPDARREKLAWAERRLERSAQGVDFVRSWLPRVLSGAYSVGTALFVGLAYDRPWGAVRQLLGGAIIGQGRISLHPDGIRHDWQAYQASVGCGAVSARAPPEVSADWFIGASPGGLSVGVRF